MRGNVLIYRSLAPQYAEYDRPQTSRYKVMLPLRDLPNGNYTIGVNAVCDFDEKTYSLKSRNAIRLTIGGSAPANSNDNMGPVGYVAPTLAWDCRSCTRSRPLMSDPVVSIRGLTKVFPLHRRKVTPGLDTARLSAFTFLVRQVLSPSRNELSDIPNSETSKSAVRHQSRRRPRRGPWRHRPEWRRQEHATQNSRARASSNVRQNSYPRARSVTARTRHRLCPRTSPA